MPKFRRRGRKHQRGRNRFKRFRGKGKGLRKRVRRIEKLIETKQIGGYTPSENEYYLPDVATFIAQTILLNGIAEGTGQSERVGEVVSFKTLELRFHGHANQDPSAYKDQTFRVMVYWDRQNNQTGPLNLGQLLEIGNVASPIEQDFQQMRSWDWRKRFRMIIDKTIRLTNSGVSENTSYVDNGAVYKKWHIKLKGKRTYWTSAGGGATDIATNALYISIISNVPESNLFGPFAWFTYRLKYQDA